VTQQIGRTGGLSAGFESQKNRVEGRPTSPGGKSFEQIMQEKISREGEVRFSAHAQERLKAREIEMSPALMDRLNEGIQKVEAKGGKDSLVLLNDLAFVVSIKNRTVVTALDPDSMRDHVFTNIDSAVIL